MNLDYARVVADAILFEGYLLYPYRATAEKNQSRWQFGVLGPPGAAAAGTGEDARLATQLLVASGARPAQVTVRFRFLQLQRRSAWRLDERGALRPAEELAVGERRWLTWDEAVDHELIVGTWQVGGPGPVDDVTAIEVPGGEDAETICGDDGSPAGRLVRSRRPLRAELRLLAEPPADGVVRISIDVENMASGADSDRTAAVAASFLGAHLLLSVTDGEFVSMTDPPDDVSGVAARCRQHRCWPVLAGPQGDRSMILVSPIILYDHPEVAPQSAGALFDSTEIDEILTLRIMTMTDEEKAAARATDPRAAEIIERCDDMSAEALQQLHGILRDPHGPGIEAAPLAQPNVDLTGTPGFNGDVPWWDPAVDGSVAPQTDAVLIQGVRVAAGSIVRIHPSRRADAQDLFFAGQTARVTAVHSDVDGETHVAVVLADDPAADLHEWYGRYLYFAPDELEPLPATSPAPDSGHREESRS